MKDKTSDAKYQDIAYRIAERIVTDEIRENTKLSGRTLLASEYNVSSETIRKAMHLLSMRHVVRVVEKSGIIVLSKDEAMRYVSEYKRAAGTRRLLEETEALIERQAREQRQLQTRLKRLFAAASKETFPFSHVAWTVTTGCPKAGITIGDRAFYEKTGTVVIATEEDGIITVAPDPLTKIAEGMVLHMLDTGKTLEKVESFMNKEDA
jgi:K+/H+ antiporter YhaU regulatory subunit KhtT